MKTFSPKRAIKFGWSTTLKNRRFLIGIVLLTFLIEGLFDILTRSITGQFSRSQFYVGSIFNIIDYLVDGVISLGLVKIALDFVDHGHAKIEDFFWVLRLPGKLISYLGASFLYFLPIVVLLAPVMTLGIMLYLTQTIGSLLPTWSALLAVPFVIGAGYFAIKYGFYTYPMTDHHAHALDSLRISGELTRGIKLKLLGFGIVLGIINVLGALALLVGLLLTIPTTLLAMAHVYRQLSPKN